MTSENEIALNNIKESWNVENPKRARKETEEILTKIALLLDNKFRFITMKEKTRGIML